VYDKNAEERDEVRVTVVCRKLCNEELHSCYCSFNIATVIKSRRMRCVGHEACLEERRNPYKILVWKSVDETPWETRGIMLEYILEKLVVKMGTGMICLRVVPDTGVF
jgi:hypothetical protein